jgi:hypothetical protein
VTFVDAAAAGDTTAAAAAARSAGIAPNDEGAMQRWLAGARMALLRAKSSAIPGATRSWLELEALAWPRRDAPGMRSALGSIAEALAAGADADPHAAARARVLAEWLATTSPTPAERARWDEMRKALPAP